MRGCFHRDEKVLIENTSCRILQNSPGMCIERRKDDEFSPPGQILHGALMPLSLPELWDPKSIQVRKCAVNFYFIE